MKLGNNVFALFWKISSKNNKACRLFDKSQSIEEVLYLQNFLNTYTFGIR